MVYPKENKTLADRILSSGGILMSEYPVGTKAEKFRFVNRNRLIVGMSKAVVIYECDAKGGTMHNYEYAVQQKKPIFCPDVGDEVVDIQTGTKKLIDENIATVIKQGRDIKGVLNAVGVKNINMEMENMVIKKIFYIQYFQFLIARLFWMQRYGNLNCQCQRITLFMKIC